jgi:hypothetical protein
MKDLRLAKGNLNRLRSAALAVGCMLCLSTHAHGAGYQVTLVDYTGKLRNVALDHSLWQDIQGTWGSFVKDVEGDPFAHVTTAKKGTLTKGEFSRHVVRLVCTSADHAARLVKGHNGSIIRGDRHEIGFIRIEKEVTFFENPLVVKKVEIKGYKGIMAEVAAFTAWFMVTHNEWEHFVDEHACPSMGHYGWKYATAGTLRKGDQLVTYVCVRPLAPEKATECLRNTERLYGDVGSGYVMVSQVGDKLLFLHGKSTNKDMWAFRKAIPEVPGFDPD